MPWSRLGSLLSHPWAPGMEGADARGLETEPRFRARLPEPSSPVCSCVHATSCVQATSLAILKSHEERHTRCFKRTCDIGT